MVNLTRIYTRTGDDGSTALGDSSRTSKNDPRLVAYADVDETNSVIGVVLAHGDLPEHVTTTLARVQNDLFDVGADLCLPLAPALEHEPLRVTPEYVQDLEDGCDRYNESLSRLRSFVLPGGSVPGAHLHVARTVCRRAERSVWRAIEIYGTGQDGGINPLTATYLNRLSDLLFILTRYVNIGHGGDVLWHPGGGRVTPRHQHQ
jgi:cob(I)alamin adenosyltransferase